MKSRLNHPASESGPRRGVVIIWFAVLLFAFIPIIALVLHTGMMTLTRRQMQTSVNSAALEGLRLKDHATNSDRREAVSNLVQAVYDDNLLSDSGDAYQFGAGPVIEFDTSSSPTLTGTSFKPSAIIPTTGPNVGISVYKPAPELNLMNERHGDQLAGQYQPAANHIEDADYIRNDFLISGDTLYDASSGDDSYLVRLRRSMSNAGNAPANDAVSNVSSTGNTVPFLFGSGPFGGNEFLDQRERGTIVRATAIANQRPALRVGIHAPGDNIEGMINVQLDIDLWLAGAPVTIGSDFASNAQIIDLAGNTVISAGQIAFDDSPGESLLGSSGYVALTDDDLLDENGVATRRIVGFAAATDLSIQAGQISFTRTDPQPVAAQNASATIKPPDDGSWDDLQLQTLFDSISAHHDEGRLLLAPALRRSLW